MNAHHPSQGATGSAIFRLARAYLAPHWRGVTVAMLAMGVIAACSGLAAWLLDPAIDKIFIEKNQTLLWQIPLAIVGVMLLRAGAEILQASIINRIGHGIIADVQVKLFDRLVQADLAQLQAIRSGDTLSSFLYDAGLIREAATNGILGLVRNLVMLLALGVVMFIQDPVLTVLALGAAPVAYLLTRRLSKRTRKAAKGSMAETANLAARIIDSLDGVRILKVHNQEHAETERVRTIIARRVKHIVAAANAKVAAGPMTEAVGGIGAAIIIAYAGWRGLTGGMELGDFVSFLTALLMAFQPLRQLANLQTVIAEGAAAADRTFTAMDLKPTIIDQPGAKPLEAPRGEITFENVSFAYGDGTPAVHTVSFTAKPGETIALVGPSGAGKTTVLNLIPRFFEAQSGQVLIDGQDVRQVTLGSLRQAIALVTQDPVLFDDTVRANICYGQDVPEGALIAAAQAADAHEFITKLPQGYDTPIGEAGNRLSGGQKQRLAIARAMLKDAPILLLDEATSALDTQSERHVQAAIDRLAQGRTVVVIAHRLSTIKAADCIYVLDQGRIVEQGTHADLLKTSGLYAKLYRQFETGVEA